MKPRTTKGPLAMIAALALAGCGGDAGAIASQEVHPEKAVFADSGEWPSVGVGEALLANFQPFRAVYERVYRNAQGEERRDRMVVTAERVAWNETAAISVSLVDAGSSAYDDTAMRIQTRVFAEDDGRLLLYLGPVPGTPRDYVVAHTDGTARATTVTAASGEASVRSGVFPLPQLGVPGLWLVGSMPLRPDQRIAFSNADAPAPSSTLGAWPVLVSGREAVDAGPLGRQEAWVVAYPLGMSGPRMMHTFVIDHPPYLLGKRPLDVDTGATTEVGTLRLVDFTAFDGGNP